MSTTWSHCIARHVLEPVGRKDAGIGAQHIDAAMAIGGRLGHGLHAVELRDIGGEGRSTFAEFLRGGFGFGEMARDDQHLAAGLGEAAAMPLPMPLLEPVTTTDLPASDVNMPNLPLNRSSGGACARRSANSRRATSSAAPKVDTVPSTGTPGV